MVEMDITGFALDPVNQQSVVLLHDPGGRRQVRIWIELAQAHSIIAALKGIIQPRPLTHDLLMRVIEVGGLHLERIVISSIEDNTFLAELRLRRQLDNEVIKLDCRPSDAIALAVRSKAGIWMLEEVVSHASLPVDEVADAEDTAEFREALANISPAELIRRSRVQLDSSQQHAGDVEFTEGTSDDTEGSSGSSPAKPAP